MGGLDQRVRVGEGAEGGVDVGVVGDVVAEVRHRRAVEGRQPHRVGPETGDVVQVRGDAGQVTDTTGVRRGEAAGVDLVEDRSFPPRRPIGDIGLICRGDDHGAPLDRCRGDVPRRSGTAA